MPYHFSPQSLNTFFFKEFASSGSLCPAYIHINWCHCLFLPSLRFLWPIVPRIYSYQLMAFLSVPFAPRRMRFGCGSGAVRVRPHPNVEEHPLPSRRPAISRLAPTGEGGGGWGRGLGRRVQVCMLRGIHKLPKVSTKPAMPDPSTPCGWATPKTALWPFRGWPAHRPGSLRPSSTPLDTPRLTGLGMRWGRGMA
jgi:hypothetical protein